MNFINDKINHIALKFFAGNNSKFATLMETNEANIRNYRKNTLPKIDFIINLHTKLNISYDWLFSDSYEQKENNLLLNTDNENYKRIRCVPLYDSMYSSNSEQPEVGEVGILNPVAHVQPGDWFPQATAAVRYYGNHMAEYPNGCILLVKKTPAESIVFGVNYVIVTKEGFLTLCLGPAENNEHILGYSTAKNHHLKDNGYQDASVLPIADIMHLFIVLGCVIK